MDDLAEHGTPEFYREQAARLTLLAAGASSAETRLEVLEIAAVFLRLAERAIANRNASIDLDAESA